MRWVDVLLFSYPTPPSQILPAIITYAMTSLNTAFHHVTVPYYILRHL